MPPGLAERLREETRLLHAEVERAGIMPALLRGEVDRAGYCRLLRNLFEIYRALEDALPRHAGRPEVAAILIPDLFRAGTLADDLVALHGPDWEQELALGPAAHAYGERLREIDRVDPARLVAHAYVRYLGDLSGGQILNRVVGKRLALAGESGRRFYRFGDLSQVHELAARFRLGLDSAAAGAFSEAIIDEAGLAFRLHACLFEELAAKAPAGTPDQSPRISR